MTNKPTYEELSAQVEVLRQHIFTVNSDYQNSSGYEPSISVFHRSLDRAVDAAMQTSPSCLAQVRAEAVESAIKSCNHHMAFPVNRGNIADKVIAVDELIMHAERILKGGAE